MRSRPHTALQLRNFLAVDALALLFVAVLIPPASSGPPHPPQQILASFAIEDEGVSRVTGGIRHDRGAYSIWRVGAVLIVIDEATGVIPSVNVAESIIKRHLSYQYVSSARPVVRAVVVRAGTYQIKYIDKAHVVIDPQGRVPGLDVTRAVLRRGYERKYIREAKPVGRSVTVGGQPYRVRKAQGAFAIADANDHFASGEVVRKVLKGHFTRQELLEGALDREYLGIVCVIAEAVTRVAVVIRNGSDIVIYWLDRKNELHFLLRESIDAICASQGLDLDEIYDVAVKARRLSGEALEYAPAAARGARDLLSECDSQIWRPSYERACEIDGDLVAVARALSGLATKVDETASHLETPALFFYAVERAFRGTWDELANGADMVTDGYEAFASQADALRGRSAQLEGITARVDTKVDSASPVASTAFQERVVARSEKFAPVAASQFGRHVSVPAHVAAADAKGRMEEVISDKLDFSTSCLASTTRCHENLLNSGVPIDIDLDHFDSERMSLTSRAGEKLDRDYALSLEKARFAKLVSLKAAAELVSAALDSEELTRYRARVQERPFWGDSNVARAEGLLDEARHALRSHDAEAPGVAVAKLETRPESGLSRARLRWCTGCTGGSVVRSHTTTRSRASGQVRLGCASSAQ